ncbi:hypothetical protein FNI40_23480 [Salmonella enterica subsp. diarizonae]|nr:hypothetical protein [Salmonella enterica subsp. diarizonae]
MISRDCGQYEATTWILKKGKFIKGREAVNFPPLITFPPSSVDELANQLQQRDKRFQSSDCFLDENFHSFLQINWSEDTVTYSYIACCNSCSQFVS